RHTRFSRDWSSDVCSSDLALAMGGLIFLALAIWGFIAIGRRKPVRRFAAAAPAAPQPRKPVVAQAAQASPVTVDAAPRRQVVQRSEERRVGTGRRSWWPRE